MVPDLHGKTLWRTSYSKIRGMCIEQLSIWDAMCYEARRQYLTYLAIQDISGTAATAAWFMRLQDLARKVFSMFIFASIRFGMDSKAFVVYEGPP